MTKNREHGISFLAGLAAAAALLLAAACSSFSPSRSVDNAASPAPGTST